MSNEEILAVMNVSEKCFQKIVNNCTNNGLSNVAWWYDMSYKKHEYWHGDGSTEKGCYCSIDGNGCHENYAGVKVDSYNIRYIIYRILYTVYNIPVQVQLSVIFAAKQIVGQDVNPTVGHFLIQNDRQLYRLQYTVYFIHLRGLQIVLILIIIKLNRLFES